MTKEIESSLMAFLWSGSLMKHSRLKLARIKYVVLRKRVGLEISFEKDPKVMFGKRKQNRAWVGKLRSCLVTILFIIFYFHLQNFQKLTLKVCLVHYSLTNFDNHFHYL